MGFIDQLFKTKEQRDTDINNYYEWAYPYGEEHKKKIDELVRKFVTDEDPKYAIYNYLVCRQYLAPHRYEGKYVVENDEFIFASKKLKKDYIAKGRKAMHKYMALVEADLMIDENFNYPSLEQLEARANQIKTIINQ